MLIALARATADPTPRSSENKGGKLKLGLELVVALGSFWDSAQILRSTVDRHCMLHSDGLPAHLSSDKK